MTFTIGYSKFEMNTLSVCQLAFIYDECMHISYQLSVYQRADMQQLGAKVFKLSSGYSQAFFAEEKANCVTNAITIH